MKEECPQRRGKLLQGIPNDVCGGGKRTTMPTMFKVLHLMFMIYCPPNS